MTIFAKQELNKPLYSKAIKVSFTLIITSAIFRSFLQKILVLLNIVFDVDYVYFTEEACRRQHITLNTIISRVLPTNRLDKRLFQM